MSKLFHTSYIRSYTVLHLGELDFDGIFAWEFFGLNNQGRNKRNYHPVIKHGNGKSTSYRLS